jgi:hypothetical protein
MTFDLKAVLPRIIPAAVAWVEAQSAYVREVGLPLTSDLQSLASTVGVRCPQLIRILEVPALPLPDDPELKHAAIATGLLGPNMIGLTLGYGIYICGGQGTIRLLSHEFRHVYQYERAGSIARFIPDYLAQIASAGYNDAPLEMDARAHEILRL